MTRQASLMLTRLSATSVRGRDIMHMTFHGLLEQMVEVSLRIQPPEVDALHAEGLTHL